MLPLVNHGLGHWGCVYLTFFGKYNKKYNKTIIYSQVLLFFLDIYWITVHYENNIWWLCLVPTSTTRFASDVGCRMAKI